jgi:hypothetical protein
MKRLIIAISVALSVTAHAEPHGGMGARHEAIEHHEVRAERFYPPSGIGLITLPDGRFAPAAVVVPILPRGFTTVNFAGGPYFYANGTYYVATEEGYAVVQPPVDAAAPAQR